MNEKYKPHFEWTLPNINAIRELKEFVNKSLSISTLLIKNANLSDSGTPKAQFSEIPSVLPPDKNFTITLFILAFDLNKSEPDVSCYLESNCSGIPICKLENQLASFMVMIRSENALVNLTTPGTSEIINVTEGDNINIACFALDYFYYYVSFNYSGKSNMCNTKLSSGRCLKIVNISLREDWFFECLA
ncbi:hypothetical protein Anas_05860, partial [Armadillidium nasatum]